MLGAVESKSAMRRGLFKFVLAVNIIGWRGGVQLNFIASLGIGRIFLFFVFSSNCSVYLITIYNLNTFIVYIYIIYIYIYLPTHFHDMNNVYH